MSEVIHLLKANGAREAPFADSTLCGLAVTDVMFAMWPGDTLAEHNIRGRWCPSCKKIGHEEVDR